MGLFWVPFCIHFDWKFLGSNVANSVELLSIPPQAATPPSTDLRRQEMIWAADWIRRGEGPHGWKRKKKALFKSFCCSREPFGQDLFFFSLGRSHMLHVWNLYLHLPSIWAKSG